MDYRGHDFQPEIGELDDLKLLLKVIGLCVLGAAAAIAAHAHWPAISHFLNLSHAARL